MRNLLIIDNDCGEAKFLTEILSKNNFRVSFAGGGQSGLKLLDEVEPEILLIDIDLAQEDGFEILSEIKTRKNCADMIIIIFSGKADDETIVKGLKSGANDFLRKPFNIDELLIKIENLYELKHSKDENQRINRELNAEKEKIQLERNLLVKYFSRDIVDGLLQGSISTELGGKVIYATLMFCDLRNSTTMAENVEPNLFSKFLSNLFTDISDLIFGQGGSINKFLGDGILATFGCPLPLDDQKTKALVTAINIRKYIQNFNSFRPKYLNEPVTVGIGIAYGKVFAGNIGSINRMEYSVLGDAVNIASRLQNLTKKAHVDILIDEHIRRVMGDKLIAKAIRGISLRGKKNKVDIFYPEQIKE